MTRYVLDCASDTHGTHKALKFKAPEDLEDREWFFVHAGDSTKTGAKHELTDFAHWVARLPHAHKVVIVGNHERETDPVWIANERARIEASLKFKLPRDADDRDKLMWNNQLKREKDRLKKLKVVDAQGILGSVCTYLHDQDTEIAGVKFYGSPYTPRFFSWGYQYDRTPEADVRWAQIPDGTHVVITHGPPNGILDEAHDSDNYTKIVHAGCSALRRRVLAIKPNVHIFGHIHDWFGASVVDEVVFVNAASVTPRYESRFKYIRVYGDTEKGVERVEVVVTTV